jgi:hypothetical protein
MSPADDVLTRPIAGDVRVAGQGAWRFSWPLVMGLAAYILFISLGQKTLVDGDTYTHVAAGDWILQHGTVPASDPFSHSKPGGAWTAHEWLSEVIMALANQAGGWTAVSAVSALAFAAAIALLTRALLRHLEPIYALLFAGLAVPMTANHLLARPHILALPLLILWTIELVRASEAGRAPRLWMLPVMTIWANLHGGFTLGLALAAAFAFEAVLAARREQRVQVARSWGIFVLLAIGSSLITPHGLQGILLTWQTLFESSYALERIGEWRSPDFQNAQPLEVWLLGAVALAMYQGLRLPAVRLALLLGLIHLALKHNRYIELLGLLAPLFIATPLGAQWRAAQEGKQHFESADRFFRSLAQPAGRGAVALALTLSLAIPVLISRTQPFEPPEFSAPVLAIKAAQKAGVTGPVLNAYGWGGYLTYLGIPPFIDGRADLYGDPFIKQYVEAMELRKPDSLQRVLDEYKITWTLLEASSSAIALLDRSPDWRRLYADSTAIVHVKVNTESGPASAQAR